MADLHAEMAMAARSVRQVHLDRLRSLGVSFDTIGSLGERFHPFGIVKAEPFGNDLYQPGQGITHVVLPVIEDGALIDLCAFRSSNPSTWFLRTGNGWALGLQDGAGRYMWGVPPHVVATPLDWMRGDCSGVCILDWTSTEIFKLDVFDTVTVADAATAKLLDRAMRRPIRIPTIQVVEALRHVA
jgi:hypothetical protein